MTTTLSLPQMVDLALGTPEVGSVNFNVLHTLLHAMLKRLDITDVKADINKIDKEFLSTNLERDVVDNKETESESEGAKDFGSEKDSAISIPPQRSHYHQLEAKLARLEHQIDQLNSLPTNSDLFDRARGSGDKPRPVADMWQYMQLNRRVDANEEGIGKLMTIVEDLMRELQEIRDFQAKLKEQLDNLNLEDLLKRLKDLETLTNELNDKFLLLPLPEEFVTWAGLEDALNGVRRDFANAQQPQERIVIEMSSQTDVPQTPVQSRPTSAAKSLSRPNSSRPASAKSAKSISSPHVSRPTSAKVAKPRPKTAIPAQSRPGSAGSSASEFDMVSRPVSARPMSAVSSTGPSQDLADILEKLGSLGERHEKLEDRVDIIEEELKKKADKDALAGLSIPDDLLEKIQNLKDELDALYKLREKLFAAEYRLTTLENCIPKDTMRESKLHLARSVEHLEEKEEDKGVRSGASLEAIRSRKQLIKKEQLDELLMKIDNLEEEVHLLQSLMEKEEESEDLTSDLAPSSPSRPLSAPNRSDHSLDFTTTPDSGFTSQSTFELLSQNFTKKLEEQARHQDSLKQGLAQQSSDIKNLGKKLNHLGGEINKQLALLRQKVENVEKELKDLFSYVDESLQARGGSSGSGNWDSEAITRAQKAILDLQAEVEKLNGTTNFLMDENTNRQKQIENIYLVTNRLEETKADKEYVDTEVDVKADKKSVEGKVNRSLFDSTCAELNKMINDLLEKLAAYEEAWKKAHGTLSDDVEGKLDRMELDALKDYIDAKLKALNKKMNATQAHDMVSQFGISDDDAAGIRKQLVTRFHCISCDRPVDMNPAQPIPSLPAPGALPPTRSPRPYTTFELEQIRQHAKSLGNGKVYYNNRPYFSGRNATNFERALAQRHLAQLRKHDLRSFKVHFGKPLLPETTRMYFSYMMGPDGVDYYATSRSCGGNHTTTFPHRRMTRITNTKDIYREEEIPAAYLALSREERDIKGSDGHVYRGRLDPRSQIEARLPTHLQAQETAPAAPAAPSRKMQTSPPGRNPRTVRPPPSSAASSRRPQSSGSGGGERPTTARPSSRPTSAHLGSSRPQSAHTPRPHPTPQPPEEAPRQPSPPPPQTPTEAFAEPPAEQPAEAQQPQSTEQNVPAPEQPAEEAEEIPK